MSRLLQIEWCKLRYYRPFWVMISMYALCVVIVCSSGMLFMAYLKSKGADFDGIDPTILPLYDYPDVWQNISYMAGFFKVILAFVVIISIANESSYRTLRQNIIDGLSISEFLSSKLLFVVCLCLGSTLLLFFIGLITASIYSSVQGWEHMFQSSEFLLAYFLGLFCYLSFALMITLLIPKAGVIIVGLLMYTIVFEPILSVFLQNYPHLSDVWREVPAFLPTMSVYYLIPIPFPKYAFMEIQDYVSIKETLIVFGWIIINITGSYLLLIKKDW